MQKLSVVAFVLLTLFITVGTFGCGSGGSGPGIGSGVATTFTPTPSPSGSPTPGGPNVLRFNPPIGSVLPGGILVFTNRNRSDAVTFSVVANNSGSEMTPAGTYIAGNLANRTDTIQEQDSANNVGNTFVIVGPSLTVSPAGTTAASGGVINYTVSGGSGTGYVFAMLSGPSGGDISTSGVYTAGTVANSLDVISVTDSVGNNSYVTVAVEPSLAINGVGNGNVSPGNGLNLTVSGGSGGVQWFLLQNLSGGSIGINDGSYTAGSHGGTTDVIFATDSSNNIGLAQISVH